MAGEVIAARERMLLEAVRRLAAIADRRIRPRIPSRTLQRALRTIIVQPGKAMLFLPHYWAIYAHDGRGPVRPVEKRWLVWFPDPNDDPRIRGGYPVRVGDIRRLTKQQWEEGLRINRERKRAGAPPYMIVTQFSGPAAGVPFFENVRLGEAAGGIVEPLMDEMVGEFAVEETDTIRLRF